jgi:hypothetical protein
MNGTETHEPKSNPSGPLEGADQAALGVSPLPAPAPPGASVDPTEELVPGATKGDRVTTESKPWFTSLAADSEHGVSDESNDPDQ